VTGEVLLAVLGGVLVGAVLVLICWWRWWRHE
jgi:hypothetical protein